MLTVLAPAKINLTLEVLAKRQDGFHEIRSVIQTVNLCDGLRFRLSRFTHRTALHFKRNKLIGLSGLRGELTRSLGIHTNESYTIRRAYASPKSRSASNKK